MSKRTKFAKIYDKFVDKIFRFIFFKVESKETAEDLTSEVFLRVWEIYQKKEIENIRAFLYQTARNLLVDHYRKREKDNHVSLDSLYPLADQKESLEEKIEKNWKLEFVKNRLKILREEYQEALFLRYV
ncbi:sigma-70 family RNA polymerase sigma factor, partial [Candidatus Parcubacteria bacterium]|nr:sigma-70 family RNA polymerase sigma factor [Candidatus Parcubacteria bacterium]